MSKKTSLAIVVTLLLSSSAMADRAQLAAEGKLLIKEFASELKGELKTAMKAGGPTMAISVCKDKAPAIAERLSKASGWEVARTSLKTRNPANAPDAWERGVLEEFESKKAAGADPKTLAYARMVEVDGRKTFRLMKAIPTGPVCLACHGGDNVKPEVEAKLAAEYPHDRARGFEVGDIRGAFTLAKPMD